MHYTIKNKHRCHYRSFLAMKTPGDLAKSLSIPVGLLYQLILDTGYKHWVKTGEKGKKRLISEPPEMLRKVLVRLNRYLQYYYYQILPPTVHGFVQCPENGIEKRNIITNATPHCNKAFVVNADIKNFFGSITPVAVRKVFLDAPFHFNEEVASALALLCLDKKRLPTGAPTSPVISNLVFFPIDAQLQILSEKYGYTYTRYADDLTFSGNDRPGSEFKSELESILSHHDFVLNPRKYRIQSRYGRQMVTGLVVNEKVNVNRRYRKQLRAMLYDIETQGIVVATQRHYQTKHCTEAQQQQFNLSIMGKKRWVEGIKN